MGAAFVPRYLSLSGVPGKHGSQLPSFPHPFFLSLLLLPQERLAWVLGFISQTGGIAEGQWGHIGTWATLFQYNALGSHANLRKVSFKVWDTQVSGDISFGAGSVVLSFLCWSRLWDCGEWSLEPS